MTKISRWQIDWGWARSSVAVGRPPARPASQSVSQPQLNVCECICLAPSPPSLQRDLLLHDTRCTETDCDASFPALKVGNCENTAAPPLLTYHRWHLTRVRVARCLPSLLRTLRACGIRCRPDADGRGRGETPAMRPTQLKSAGTDITCAMPTPRRRRRTAQPREIH